MLLRQSSFVHLIPVADDRVLVIDAINNMRLVVTQEVARFIRSFAGFKEVAGVGPHSVLFERGILTGKSPDDELTHVADLLSPYHGRDPDTLAQILSTKVERPPADYWAVSSALRLDDLARPGRRVDVLLFGDCDVHMESDFLRQEAASRGIDLRIVATFPDDLRLAAEHRHDAVFIGALRTRHTLLQSDAPHHAGLVAEARKILDGLRRYTSVPILIDNLPEPTVEPQGMAERGPGGHRNRFRAANLALAELVDAYSDVCVVDIAAALAAAGAEKLVDDSQVGFTHLGSPGWLLQRAESEKLAVHGLVPDLAPLAKLVGADPYAREKVTARKHVDALAVVLGIDRKKCVIVDLDGILWPGVLAETGRPFAWHPDISPPFSHVGIFFGLHEALSCLKKRGFLLTCVSQNDEATVRELWKYEDHYPQNLLTPDDFVTWRVNWQDKVENIRSISDELGLALESFLFIDDNPVERDRVRQRLPEVEVWGEDIVNLRRKLLSDPRLQLPRLTEESAARTELTKATLNRQAARAESLSEEDFRASLNLQVRVEWLGQGAPLERIAELFQRTTQFNTTGAKYSVAELNASLKASAAAIYAVHVADRFGDHGLVGAAVIKEREIAGFVLSCRVLGLGVEHAFLREIIAAAGPNLTGRIIPTSRNVPARNLYRDNGFLEVEDGVWRRVGAA